MRKKYLSALLFGALLFASTGTFTSCKDYDDDIDGLQEQIDSMETTISTLQNQVSSGYWITSLNAINGGFAVTFSNGQSYNIVNGADGQDGAAGKDGTQITIGEDGYWYFDGVKSDYQAVVSGEDGKVKAPYVEDGYWYFYAEDSEEATKSDIKAAGAAYAVEANGGWNLYLPDADGEMNEAIFLPGAAASITSLSVEENAKLEISSYNFKPSDTDKKTWKELTGVDVTSNEYILSASKKLGLRINPVNVDATSIDFDLVNSKNEYLGLTLKAEEYKDYVTSDSRAAYGNGLYAVSLSQLELKDQDALDKFTAKFKKDAADILYALSASTAIRSEYRIAVSKTDAKAAIGDILVNGEDPKDCNHTPTTPNDCVTVDSQKENQVTVKNPADLYDMWLAVSDEDKNLFGIEFDQEKQTFTVKADPDILTKAYFDLTVHTMNNEGTYATETIRVHVSGKIAISADYSLQTLPIVKDDTDAIKNKNAFTADMATLQTALGDQLDVWKRKVTGHEVKYYEDADCKKEITSADGIDLIFVNAKGDAEAAAIKDAASMKFAVTNADASGVFEVDKEYYAKVTFTGDEGELNSVVVPFMFTIPELSTMFEIRSAYVVDDVINAYFYDATNKATAVALERYFSKCVEDVDNIEATGKIGDKESSALTTIANTTDFKSATIDLKDGIDDKGKPAGAYGEAVTVKVTKDDYYTWEYQAEGAGEYTFQIRLMSPVYQGSIAVLAGSRVAVSANDFVNGADITEKDIEGRDYNGNNLYIFPDEVDATDATKLLWKNEQIANVTPGKDKDEYIESAVVTPATSDNNGVVTKGVINLKGRSLSNSTDIDLPVTIEDAWGYKLEVTVPVTVQVQ